MLCNTNVVCRGAARFYCLRGVGGRQGGEPGSGASPFVCGLPGNEHPTSSSAGSRSHSHTVTAKSSNRSANNSNANISLKVMKRLWVPKRFRWEHVFQLFPAYLRFRLCAAHSDRDRDRDRDRDGDRDRRVCAVSSKYPSLQLPITPVLSLKV